MMDVAQRNREQFDDTAILRIVSDRADPLLKVVGRARALQPLIAVLAVLPVLVVLQRGGLTDSGAVWGLRALEVMESQTAEEFLAPGRSERTRRLAPQPPAASWLTAGVLRVVGTERLQSALLVSLLSAAGCVWWTFRLFHRMVGPRTGFWAAVLLATHGGLFSIAGSASPTAPALLLVLMTFNAWLRHFRVRDALVTLPLLLAGIALGLCVLTGGLMAFACLAVLLLQPAVSWLLQRISAWNSGHGPPLGRSAVAGAVVLMTAFCVAGWWIGVSGDFWGTWVSGYDRLVLSGTTPAIPLKHRWMRADAHWLIVLGPLAPLCLFGLWQMCRRSTDSPAVEADGEALKSPNAFLLSWLIVGIGFQWLVDPYWSAGGVERTLSEVFLIVPAIGLAAVAVDGFLQRESPVSVVVLAAVLAVGLTPVALWLQNPSFDLTRTELQLTGILMGIAGMLWWGIRWVVQLEIRSRVIVAAAVVSLLSTGFVGGILSMPSQPLDERRLDALRAKLPATSAAQIYLVTDAPPPARLEYALRSLHPGGSLVNVNTRTSAAREVLAKTKPDAEVLVVEWIAVGKPTTIADLRGRKFVQVAAPLFYRERELRAYVMKSNPSEPAADSE